MPNTNKAKVINKVRKRDGRLVNFNTKRIE